ncbi:Fic family protein [Flavobacterium zepuense]|uniref:Fic family protein n=1 Tax=Flavobacterium zepuense TaxID=2593302 RepID=A0A552V2J7_9FLAO|nr:Fic family protein [Flavobacterium zepuense]TRW24684.1 Fic family protein [Flavobacterium zepuense]
MIQKTSIIPTELLETYKQGFDTSLQAQFEALQESELSTSTFSFYTSVSAVFSSKIEGEDIQLDSFIKHKRFGAHFQPDYTQKIDDLYEAYQFAASNKLTPQNILKAHVLLTKNILQQNQQGKLRQGNMFVITDDGKIEYVAATPDIVQPEMDKLYSDLKILLNAELSFAEIFFYASLLHLVFVKIHPFEDGNGRTARLVKKWFLAGKLGAKAWFIQSEKNYYRQHQTYYYNIRKLGLEYPDLDYSKALPFLEMLPKSVVTL